MPANATRVRPYLLSAALIALILVLASVASPVAAHSPAAEQSAAEVVSGTVAAVVIENQVNKTSFDYRELNLEDGTAIPLYGKAAESLQSGTRVRITRRRAGTPLEAANVEVLATPSLSGQAGEAAIEVEGTLAIAHGDDFAASKSRYFYRVHGDDAKVTTLEVTSLPTALRGGSRVVVSGKHGADASSLRPERITITADPAGSSVMPSGLVAQSATTNTVLVIMANFNNTVAPSYTQTQAQQVMTTNSGSVANFYSEVSYGQQLFNVTVTSSWVTMNLAGTCSYTSIASAANAAALALSPTYNASNYDFVVYLFTGQSCGWAGLAYVGYPHQAFINGTGAFVTQVVAHEMGHNFSLWHAGSLNCIGATISMPCSVAEYGDPWDTMGNQQAMHFNARQKSLLNWIPASSVKTHTSGSATYSLAPLETGGATTYAVKIPTASSQRTYWIEYRQPLGFDAPLASHPSNGAQIRVANPFEWTFGSDDTQIVDMTPATSGDFTDSALLVGQSYLDSTYGVNVIVLGATASALTVSVTTAGGAATTTTLASASNPSNVGTSVTFTATVTGTNPTGSVNFKDGASSITGCSAVVLAGSGNSPTAACTTNALAGGAHSLVATYGGDAANAGSSSAALSQTVNKIASTTGIATSLTPSTAGSSVTFTATVSGSAPTGSVNFLDGAISISGCAAVTLAGSGNIRTASCATASLAAGSHSITAVYGGDTSNNGSTSSTLTQTVNKATSTTTMSSSANPSSAGASVTFTASVTGFSPTGNVNFTDGGISISGCSAVALIGSGNTRSAQCSTSALTVATHLIAASYGGNISNTASVSATLSELISSVAPPSSLVNPSFETPTLPSGGYQYNPSATGIGWTFSSNSGIQRNGSPWNAAAAPDGVQTALIQTTSTISQTLSLNAGGYTLTFKVAQRSGQLQPIRVSVDGTQVGSLVSPASTSFALVSIPFSVASTGTHTLTFSGTDASGDKSTFIDAITLSSSGVVATTTTTTLASSLNPSTVGSNVTFTATVNGSAPTGSVNFTNGGISISGCSAVALAGSGNSRTAQCSTSTLTAGTHSIVASYGGDAGNTVSVSATLSQVINSIVTSVNVALASAGAVASASSTYSSAYPAAAINNGDRAGLNFGAGGVWKDATLSVWPDWVEIDFSSAQTIDRVIVYSVQDNSSTPVDPNNTMTFTLRGVTAFAVQTWNGSAWITQGSVTGNNLVKRTVSFTATTTTKIRVNTTAAANGKYSFLTEVEAWTPGP